MNVHSEIGQARRPGEWRRFLTRAVLAIAVLCLAIGMGTVVAQAPSFALRVSGTLLLAPPESNGPGSGYSCNAYFGCRPAPAGTLITALNGDNLAALTVCGYSQVSDDQGHYQLDIPLSAADACITNGAAVSRSCADGMIGLIFAVNGGSAGGTCAPRRLGAAGQVSLVAGDFPDLPLAGAPYTALPIVRFVGRAGRATFARSSDLSYSQAATAAPAPLGTTLYAYALANAPGSSSFYPTENGPGDSGEVFCGSGQVYDDQGNFAIDALPLSSQCEGAGSPGLTYTLMAETGYYVLGATFCVPFDPGDGQTWGRSLPVPLQIDEGGNPYLDPLIPPPPPPVLPEPPWETQPVPGPAQPVPPPPGLQPGPQPAPALPGNPVPCGRALPQSGLEADQKLQWESRLQSYSRSPYRFTSARLGAQNREIILLGTIQDPVLSTDDVTVHITQGAITGINGGNTTPGAKTFRLSVQILAQPNASCPAGTVSTSVYKAGPAIAQVIIDHADGTEESFDVPITIQPAAPAGR